MALFNDHNMRLTCERCVLVLSLMSIAAASLPPKGAAAWVYDTKGGDSGMWAGDIGSFNARAKTQLNTIWSYGGDMEYYEDLTPPFKTYFSSQGQEAALKYKNITGVEYVVAVIDGRMDGGNSWSPDLSKFNSTQLKQWAQVTADVYCSYSYIDGLQMDLEPFTGKYRAPFLTFLRELSSSLRSAEHNCVNAAHPQGRSITTFAFADAVTDEMWAALGPNGYVTVSGYDLSDKPAGTPSLVSDYKSALSSSVDDVLQSATKNKGSFYLGIPAAASCHEFENFTREDGSVVAGHPQIEYVQAAIQVINEKGLASTSAFLGSSLWGFSSEMAYPPHSQNIFLPGTPFADPGEESWLETHM